MKNQTKNLKYGFTTGTCAAAAATGAYLFLRKILSKQETSINDSFQNISLPIKNQIPVLLPDNKTIDIHYSIIHADYSSVTVEVIKDAGDDPDITNHIPIRVNASYINTSDIKKEDYSIILNSSKLILSSNGGIGIVTKKGLDADFGKWAINSVPRKMILDNLRHNGFENDKNKILKISIEAVNGTEIAKKTLNKMLGVIGGLSILGTSGIVVPYSNAAYIKTIEILIKSLNAEGFNELALVTGNKTKKALLKTCPTLEESQIIRIADFIGASLEAVTKFNFKTVHIACMPGKLYKYACGNYYTHAHKTALDMSLLILELQNFNLPQNIMDKLKSSKSVAEAMTFLNEDTIKKILNILAIKALNNLKKWANNINIKIYVFTSDNEDSKPILQLLDNNKILNTQ